MKSSAVITESHFLPSLYYFSVVAEYGLWMIEAHENYNKGSFRNRMMISGNQGTQAFSVPLAGGKNGGTPIRKVRIVDEEDWSRSFSHALQTEYGKFPYFEIYYHELISRIESFRSGKLFDLNWSLLQWLVKHLELDEPLLTSSYQFDPGGQTTDLRDQIRPVIFRNHPCLLESRQLGYFHFVPGHSVLEALFAYGPETRWLLDEYGHSRKPF